MSYLQFSPDPSRTTTTEPTDTSLIESMDARASPSLLNIVHDNDTTVYDPWVTKEHQRRLKKHFNYASLEDNTFALAEVPLHRLLWSGPANNTLHLNDEVLHVTAIGSLVAISFHTDKYVYPRFSIHLELLRNSDQDAMAALFSFSVPNRIIPDELICIKQLDSARQAFWDVYYAPVRIRPNNERLAFSSLRKGDVVLVHMTVHRDSFGMPTFRFTSLHLLCMAPRVL